MAYARDWELQYYQQGTKTVKKGDPEQDGQLFVEAIGLPEGNATCSQSRSAMAHVLAPSNT
jgi:hypothetical protein